MTTKKEVRFEGEYQDTLPRSRSYSGRSTGSSGRRRKGSRQRKYTSDNRLNDTHPQSQPHGSHSSSHVSSHGSSHGSSHSKKEHHHRSKHQDHRSGRDDRPGTSAQARLRADMIDGHHEDDSDSSTDCSTCSSSSSDSDDVAYKLPQRRTYGGTRVSYVPNDALAIARKQQLQQQRKSGNISAADTSTLSDKDNKNCIIS